MRKKYFIDRYSINSDCASVIVEWNCDGNSIREIKDAIKKKFGFSDNDEILGDFSIIYSRLENNKSIWYEFAVYEISLVNFL